MSRLLLPFPSCFPFLFSLRRSLKKTYWKESRLTYSHVITRCVDMWEKPWKLGWRLSMVLAKRPLAVWLVCWLSGLIPPPQKLYEDDAPTCFPFMLSFNSTLWSICMRKDGAWILFSLSSRYFSLCSKDLCAEILTKTVLFEISYTNLICKAITSLWSVF